MSTLVHFRRPPRSTFYFAQLALSPAFLFSTVSRGSATAGPLAAPRPPPSTIFSLVIVHFCTLAVLLTRPPIIGPGAQVGTNVDPPGALLLGRVGDVLHSSRFGLSPLPRRPFLRRTSTCSQSLRATVILSPNSRQRALTNWRWRTLVDPPSVSQTVTRQTRRLRLLRDQLYPCLPLFNTYCLHL